MLNLAWIWQTPIGCHPYLDDPKTARHRKIATAWKGDKRKIQGWIQPDSVSETMYLFGSA